jgi:SSS family solute:Na+ symporter
LEVKSGNLYRYYQWLILIGGLVFIGIPVAYNAVGGYDAIKATLRP